MLTKEHIKARVRGKKVVPDFIEPADRSAVADATAVLSAFNDAAGLTLGEVRERMQGDSGASSAFYKLLTDRCTFDEFSDGIEEARWKLFAISKSLRAQGPQMTPSEFRARVAVETGSSYAAVSDDLYADLPDLKRVRAVDLMEPSQLINRYNISQVQGLLLKAHTLTITVKDASLAALRQLFHQIRFHRLMARIEPDPKMKKTVIVLTGPMGMFEQSSSYGLQLALFFPRLLSFEGWTAEAEVEHKRGKTHTLKLEQSSGLLPIYKVRDVYVPPELTQFLETFNGVTNEFAASAGGEVLNLGNEQYLIPDITINGQGRTFVVELFHKWHASQLASRLRTLENTKKQGVFLGVARNIAKNRETEKLLKDSFWFAKYGFLFSDFPTSKTLLSLVGKVCRGNDEA